MRLARRIVRAVRVPMMLVVDVAVRVLDRRMMVRVLVPLAQMQVQSYRHERPGGEQT